jgi:hypothetical protein
VLPGTRRLLPISAAIAVAFAALSFPRGLLGAGPVVHEYIEPDPGEDLQLQATTLKGSMPAALDTPSGVVPAPDPARPRPQSETAYGGSSTPNSTDATYRIDRDTSRPDVVSYDDPFVPAVTPFKRLYAFDSADDALELVVRDKSLRSIEVGGEARPSDDQFYADMSVDLQSDTAVRVPTVGPDARVLSAQTDPPTRFELLRDAADNWFIRADVRKRVRLMMHLAIARQTFGSDFADVPWPELQRHAPELPEAVRRVAEDVASQLGVTRTMGTRSAVAALVQHFRSFAPSEERPDAASSVALYKELALSKKGVCRHRAYAFVITALGMGIPSRLIRNEAHAWVEVYDTRLWHRIDLGGAAGRLDFERDPGTQLHQPPNDPYRWPEGGESGREMTERSLGSSAPGNAQPSPDGAPADSAGRGTKPPEEPREGDPTAEPDARAPSVFTLEHATAEVRRGAPLSIRGKVESDGDACGYARVDVSLRATDGRLLAVGALATDAGGRFEGAVTVPLSLQVGDYDVIVSTPGGSRCGPGRSQ